MSNPRDDRHKDLLRPPLDRIIDLGHLPPADKEKPHPPPVGVSILRCGKRDGKLLNKHSKESPMLRIIVLLLVLSGCTTLGQDVSLIEIDGWKLGVYERNGLTNVGPAESGWESDWIRYRNAAIKAAEQVTGCEVADYEVSDYKIQAKMDCS